MDDPVVVIGGGIGGLTAGLALLHQGIPVTVYERAPELHEIGAGVGLWPAALTVLDRLGIGDKVRSLGGTWEVAGLRRADGKYLVRYTADQLAAQLGEATAGVHRGELQSVLADALPDGTLRTGQRCVGVEQLADGSVTVRFEGGRTERAGAVIAADGRRSPIRSQLFGHTPLHDCKYLGWRGTATAPPGSDWHAFAGETWGSTGRFGFLPISGGRVTWYATAQRYQGEGGRAELLDRFGSWHHPIASLLEATDESNIWRDRIDDHRPFRRWSRGSVTLLGDAAHPMTPELGQGACQAIIDAWAVAEELARQPDVASAFAAYERRRRRRAAMVTMVARVSGIGGRPEGRFVPAVRERLAARAPASVVLRQLKFVAREA